MTFRSSNLSSFRRLIALLAFVSLLPGIASATGKLQQVGTLSALSAGVYDGTPETMDVLQRPDAYGLGTFDRLDGEMVVLDGVVYQIPSTGKAVKPHNDSLIPFACVSILDSPDVSENLGSVASKSDFEKLITDKLQSMNYPALIVVNGKFSSMRTRSVPAQKKPYLPLAETLAAQQVEFDLGAQQGTLVGFYCPSWMAGLNATGFHLHFLNESHSAGGHVLDFVMESGLLRIQTLTGVQVILPGTDSSFALSDIEPAVPAGKTPGE